MTTIDIVVCHGDQTGEELLQQGYEGMLKEELDDPYMARTRSDTQSPSRLRVGMVMGWSGSATLHHVEGSTQHHGRGHAP